MERPPSQWATYTASYAFVVPHPEASAQKAVQLLRELGVETTSASSASDSAYITATFSTDLVQRVRERMATIEGRVASQSFQRVDNYQTIRPLIRRLRLVEQTRQEVLAMMTDAQDARHIEALVLFIQLATAERDQIEAQVREQTSWTRNELTLQFTLDCESPAGRNSPACPH
jgi:hypothetical protein